LPNAEVEPFQAPEHGFRAPGPHFERQLENGRFVLVVGDGVEKGTLAVSGAEIAGFHRVRELLGGLADIQVDPTVDVDELWSLACRKHAPRAHALLHDNSTPTDDGVSPLVQALSSVAFFEVYDLTLNDVLSNA